MSRSTVVVDTESPVGAISPFLYGHFAEHLGRCCYDGLWVGHESTIPNLCGWRLDVLDALKRVGVPILRWPGGCFADTYHWRDGIGPSDQRPRSLAESCGAVTVETNQIGTHEFIDLCRELGAEPYLAGNVGSGTPQELMDWVQYCNSTADTSLVQQRIMNGHPKSMNVRYWGVGNENWACGGNYDATDYGKEFKRYATFIKQADQTAELVACGDHDPDWNTKLIEANRNHIHLMDHISIHRYWAGGKATEFTKDEYYQLHRGPGVVDRDIRATDEILKFFVGDKKDVRIAFDEWGVWHREAAVGSDFEAQSTLSDAVSAAGTFDVFHKWCNRLSMANIAQIVNVLQALVQTEGASMWLTPTYHVFNMYAAHRGATALQTEIAEAPSRDVPAVYTGRHVPKMEAGSLSMLSASASQRDGMVAVSLSNRHHDDPLEVHVSVRGTKVEKGLVTALTGDAPNACNSAANPNRVTLNRLDILVKNNELVVTLPPCSVQTILLKGA